MKHAYSHNNIFSGTLPPRLLAVLVLPVLVLSLLVPPASVRAQETASWPEGPLVNAHAAIVMDADTGAVLYEKNIHERMYPASTTKMLTCLIAAEEGTLYEQVPFSYEAVHSVPPDGSNIGMDAGESMPLETCLYGILVGSANEVSNAVAEYVSGSMEAFAQKMNERAAMLGCTDSHFANANGLYEDDHYTSAHDLALIGRAFFDNDLLAGISGTPRYHFEATATQPDDFYVNNKHKIVNGEYRLDGVIGGKTGYTDESLETLVTCAERDGLRLICVVMKCNSPDQFRDTVSLCDFAFQNFAIHDVSGRSGIILPGGGAFPDTAINLFDRRSGSLEIAPGSRIVLPVGASYTDLRATTEPPAPADAENGTAAILRYSYADRNVGNVRVLLRQGTASVTDGNERRTIFINLYVILFGLLFVMALTVFVRLLSALVSARFVRVEKKDRRRYRRRKKELKKRHFS